MAIERKQRRPKTYTFDTELEADDLGDDLDDGSMESESDMDTAPEMPEVEVAEETSTSIPASILGGQSVSPGDVIRLEVINADDENGMVTVKYATQNPKEMI